jgi:hypothetical protein
LVIRSFVMSASPWPRLYVSAWGDYKRIYISSQ